MLIPNKKGIIYYELNTRNKSKTIKKTIYTREKPKPPQKPKILDVFSIKNEIGHTSLHLACYSEDPKILEKILNKIDQETLPELLKIKDNYGCTPARLAYANTNQEIKNILNKKALKPS